MLNNKYIKTKQNRKLKTKFFEPFKVLHPVEKQVYKLEISQNWKIHDVFHILLLEQETTMKGQVEEIQLELNVGDGEDYKVEAIWDSTVYTKESESDHLLGFNYLVS